MYQGPAGWLELERPPGVHEHPLDAERRQRTAEHRDGGGQRCATGKPLGILRSLFRHEQAPLGTRGLAGQGPDPTGDDGEARIAVERAVVELREPAPNRVDPAGVDVRLPVFGHQARGRGYVPSGQSMRDRPIRRPVFLVPGRRPLMDALLLARLSPTQLGQQHLTEQPVVPIPPAVVILRHDEQVPAFDLRQPGSGSGVAEHRVAQRPRHLVEHGGPQQEPDRVGRLAGQDLFAEVVHDELVAAGDPGG